jgi:ABC-2 type transport system permease protein
MSNVLTIARKELKTYFTSPIAYIVLAISAVIFGFFFYSALAFFVQRSMEAQMMGRGMPMSVNEFIIRPLLMNLSVISLFLVPMITMRLYAEEKRSGTIELLLTSPLTDWQIVLGKFLGVLSVYGLMLLVSLFSVLLLFVFGDPEWRQVATSYLGLLLLGGCFIAVGLFFSSLTRSQLVAGALTFAALLMLWIINWTAETAGPTLRVVISALSVLEHFEDFSRGVVDTKHLVYYISFITFGLFLTTRAVDSERWKG